MKKGSFWKNYGFLILMLTGIVAGCVVGAIWPAVMEVVDGETIIIDKGATVLEPLGTVFLNLMFCIAVPTVFCSISVVDRQYAERQARRQDHGRDHCNLPCDCRDRLRYHVCDGAAHSAGRG